MASAEDDWALLATQVGDDYWKEFEEDCISPGIMAGINWDIAKVPEELHLLPAEMADWDMYFGTEKENCKSLAKKKQKTGAEPLKSRLGTWLQMTS